MRVDVELHRHAAYLCATVRGAMNLPAVRKLVEQVAEALERRVSPLLLDVRDTADRLSYTGMLLLMEAMNEHRAVFVRRIAIVYRNHNAEDAARFLELYAGNRGFLVQTFRDKDAAREWLLGRT